MTFSFFKSREHPGFRETEKGHKIVSACHHAVTGSPRKTQT